MRCYSIFVYLVPTEVIFYDAGKNFTDQLLQANSDILCISKTSVPVKTAHLLSVVKRYQQLICLVHSIVVNDFQYLDIDDAAKMVVKYINDFVGLDVLVALSLILGALHHFRIPTGQRHKSSFNRAADQRKAAERISGHFVQPGARNVVNWWSRPNVTDAHNCSVGALALVYHGKLQLCYGPFFFLHLAH